MSRELLSLIGEATGRRVRWNDVIVMNNVGTIPPMKDVPGDFVWNRGFNVVVLNAIGWPKYFCKCRTAGDERLTHETASMVALRKSPALAHYIPPTYQAHSHTFQILVTQFMAGKPLNDVFDRARGRRLAAAIRHAMGAVVDLSLQATKMLPELLDRPHDVDVREQGTEVLDYLGTMGLPKSDVDTMADVLGTCVSLPRQLQHGDLWPANVMRAGKRLWFLDFEMYGRVQVPMYDVFHFLKTSSDRWTSRSGPAWIDQIARGGPSTDLLVGEIGRARRALGLSPEQVNAALVFYVTHFAAITHRRNPEGQVWKSFYDEVTALANHLRRGERNPLLAIAS